VETMLTVLTVSDLEILCFKYDQPRPALPRRGIKVTRFVLCGVSKTRLYPRASKALSRASCGS